MQQLIIDFIVIVLISVGIGIVAAMTGISGGAFKTPLLIILFALTAEVASAASLLSALFIAFVSTIVYYRQNSQLIDYQVGIISVIATIPGTFVGIFFRTIAAHAHILRYIFGIILFPVALKLIFAIGDDSEIEDRKKTKIGFSELDKIKLAATIIAIFMAGVSAGLLGLGGGTIIVPVLYIVLRFPMIMAAATSMFTMIFTTSAGSVVNYFYLAQSEQLLVFLYYGLIMGIGMIIGGFIGPRYASRVNEVFLQRIFGFLLIFPLIKMMNLGQFWLDPEGLNFVLATIGDTIIWLGIGIPLWVLSSRRIQTEVKDEHTIIA
ncbi:MAG: sulfite exporter TauE/SafE family protein [Candidatus Thorarchaeota archaeon]